MKNSLLKIISLFCSICILVHSEATEESVEGAEANAFEEAIDVLISYKKTGLKIKFDTAYNLLAGTTKTNGTIKKRILEKLKKEIEDKCEKNLAELKEGRLEEAILGNCVKIT